MNDVAGTATDVRETLSYSSDKIMWKSILLGGLVALLGGAVLLLSDEYDKERLVAWAMLIAGAGWCLYAFAQINSPYKKPLLVLSPEGVLMRIPMLKEFLIPWTVIKDVDSIDIEGSNPGRGGPITYTNVTVIAVPTSFYEQNIYVDSFFMRGPGWANTFLPRGDVVLVALHHAILPVTAEELRAAVEARWRAFGGAATAQAAATVH